MDDNKKSRKDAAIKCRLCRKKLGLILFSCKCEPTQFFCINHRYPEAHGCVFDFRKEQQEKIKQDNPIISMPKVAHI